MKLIISLDEVKRIVAAHLKERGYKVSAEKADTKRHTEGLYEESLEVVDGLVFEIEEDGKAQV